MTKSKETKMNEEILKNSNLLFSELSRYVQYFCNYNVQFSETNALLLQLCSHYQMDKNQIRILLTELLSNQKNPTKMFTEKEMLLWSLMKRGERMQKFGFSNNATIIGLTIKFIDSDDIIRQIMLLNKELNEELRNELLK